MSFAVKYSEAELVFIREQCAARTAPRIVAHEANVKFHSGKPIRTERSIEFAVVKLGLTNQRFTRTCEICATPFKTAWPQARYCTAECRAVTDRAYANRAYRQNPVKNVQDQTVRQRQRLKERWQRILAHFGDKCSKCGHSFPHVVYDLHHPNGKPNRKETPSRVIRSGPEKQFLKLLSETILMCANCHRLTHAELGNWAPGRKDS